MQDQISETEHKNIRELLPWLVNGRLSSEESERVKTHLPHCKECRGQVSLLQLVNQHLTEEKSAWKPSSTHFASILSEVEHLEAASTKRQKNKQSKDNRLVVFLQSLMQSPTPVRWTLALESMAIVALLMVWTTSPQSGSNDIDDVFRTLSDSPQNIQAVSTSKIRILFNEEMSTAELTKLLRQTGAQIRQGPSGLGFFVIEIPQERTEQTMETFRNHQHIILAQPLKLAP